MDTTDLREPPDPGMYGCDRALFARVWDRVASPDSPVEADLAPAGPPAEDREPGCLTGTEEAGRLQELVLACVTAAAAYRRGAARAGRQAPELLTMAQGKTRHAKRLSAACFLMTGVRYWPAAAPTPPREDLLGLLRGRFLAEQRLAARLRALGEGCRDECLRELYLELAEETRELVRVIRRAVERAV